MKLPLILILLVALDIGSFAMTSEVRRVHGKPQLFVDGKIATSLLGYSLNDEDYADLVKAGIDVVDLDLSAEWKGPGE